MNLWEGSVGTPIDIEWFNLDEPFEIKSRFMDWFIPEVRLSIYTSLLAKKLFEYELFTSQWLRLSLTNSNEVYSLQYRCYLTIDLQPCKYHLCLRSHIFSRLDGGKGRKLYPRSLCPKMLTKIMGCIHIQHQLTTFKESKYNARPL